MSIFNTDSIIAGDQGNLNPSHSITTHKDTSVNTIIGMPRVEGCADPNRRCISLKRAQTIGAREVVHGAVPRVQERRVYLDSV